MSFSNRRTIARLLSPYSWSWKKVNICPAVWCSTTDKQRYSHKVNQSWWSPQDRPGVRREMEKPRDKWQELQRNLGKQGSLQAIWHVGKGSQGQGWTARCEECPWVWKESFRQTCWMPEVARQGLGGCPTTGTQKNNHLNALSVPARGSSGKGKHSWPRQDWNAATRPPGPAPSQEVMVVLLSRFQKETTAKSVTLASSEWWLLQAQTLCMQIKASRHNSLKKKN